MWPKCFALFHPVRWWAAPLEFWNAAISNIMQAQATAEISWTLFSDCPGMKSFTHLRTGNKRYFEVGLSRKKVLLFGIFFIFYSFLNEWKITNDKWMDLQIVFSSSMLVNWVIWFSKTWFWTVQHLSLQIPKKKKNKIKIQKK